MKVYKLEIFIIDFDEIGEDQIMDIIEDTRYPNDCIHPQIMKIDSRDIGEWNDDHPLNDKNICKEEYRRMFDDGTYDDFIKCARLANKLASFFPEEEESWVGSVSERLVYLTNRLRFY